MNTMNIMLKLSLLITLTTVGQFITLDSKPINFLANGFWIIDGYDQVIVSRCPDLQPLTFGPIEGTVPPFQKCITLDAQQVNHIPYDYCHTLSRNLGTVNLTDPIFLWFLCRKCYQTF